MGPDSRLGHSTDGAGDARRGGASSDARPPEDYPTGVIVGAVLIRDIVPVAEVDDPWAFGPMCHRVSRAIQLPQPVPYKGRLGLYNVDPVLLGYENLEVLHRELKTMELEALFTKDQLVTAVCAPTAYGGLS